MGLHKYFKKKSERKKSVWSLSAQNNRTALTFMRGRLETTGDSRIDEDEPLPACSGKGFWEMLGGVEVV